MRLHPHALSGQLIACPLFAQGYRADSFACKASERAAELLPKIACIVHNRHAVRSTRATVAFDTLHQDSSQRIWEGFQAAKSRRAAQSGRSPPVFSDKGNPNQEQFCRLYTGGAHCGRMLWCRCCALSTAAEPRTRAFCAATMREMFGTGVASAHTGIPLHRVLDAQSAIHRAFNRRKNGGIIRQDTCANLIAVIQHWLPCVLPSDPAAAPRMRSIAAGRELPANALPLLCQCSGAGPAEGAGSCAGRLRPAHRQPGETVQDGAGRRPRAPQAEAQVGQVSRQAGGMAAALSTWRCMQHSTHAAATRDLPCRRKKAWVESMAAAGVFAQQASFRAQRPA